MTYVGFLKVHSLHVLKYFAAEVEWRFLTLTGPRFVQQEKGKIYGV